MKYHAACAKKGNCSFVGEFSKIRYIPEPAYGYEGDCVQLWHEGDKFFGLYSALLYPLDLTPLGLLENVQFDSATGDLSFTAKLSVAGVTANLSVPLGDGNNEWTHDVFTFKGVCFRDVISGVLTQEQKSSLGDWTSATRIRLKKVQKPEYAIAIEASSYDEWKAAVEPILKIRGPKW